MTSCRAFRGDLERALEGRRQAGRLVELSFDGHLIACADCRGLLDSEQALELLLASLPEPRLPEELAQRVLARLRHEREAGLDALLERAPAPRVPANLARRVRAAVAGERSAPALDPLDRLLDAVPAPRVPATLAVRVQKAARKAAGRGRPRVVRGVALGLALAAAAALIALILPPDLWSARETGGESVAEPVPQAAGEALSDEFLAAFDVLENWELLNGEDLDFLLASIDEIDELVFEESLWSETGLGIGAEGPK